MSRRQEPRVLVVTNDFPPRAGGIETYVDRVVSHLDPDRVVVHACAQDDSDGWDRTLPYPVVRDPARLLLPGPGLAARVRETARQHGASAVWFPSAAPLALLAPALRGAGTTGVQRVVASAHGHEVWWARLPLSRTALRRIGSSVDVLTFDSAVVRRPIASALGAAAAARLVQLSPAVDAARFSGVPRARAVLSGAGGPVVLCVSRAVPRKGHGRLLDVWPDVRRSHPSARLVLAGSGPELARLRSRAAGMPGVEVLGRVAHDDLPRLYAAADVFVLPVADRLGGLVTESLGIVLLEAAAAGLPVVSGRAGGTVEAVLDGRTGLLLDATDRAALLGAVDRVLSDPVTSAGWGEAGQEWVARAWTWDRTAQRLRSLLAGEPVPRW
ncbi:glycosyltransferase family 4 protein [Aquipuribacter sp. MA13-6]|uniref:glycosyltransferase family 4 protein n=1 Tax=unclassified Aquipuribacter TaxID=2635084 RepID=UPI003EEF557F